MKGETTDTAGMALKPDAELATIYGSLDPAKETIVYCHTGIRAARHLRRARAPRLPQRAASTTRRGSSTATARRARREVATSARSSSAHHQRADDDLFARDVRALRP
jgi:3-mercaptopyruvate sulfurtransferase SseA